MNGYERPLPLAYDGGVLGTVAGAETAWMVGDNPEADVRGAEAVGLPAILVRSQKHATRHHREGLSGIAGIIEKA